MGTFIKRLVVFLALPGLLLYGLQFLVDSGLRQSHHPYYQEWNDLFHSRINAEILISGSSRAVNDISPLILDTMLHTNSYNIGMDGTHHPVQFDRLQLYMQHNEAPKLLIQVVGITSFVDARGLDNPLQFLPYLNDTGVIRLTSAHPDHFTFAERYLPMVKYSNQAPLIIEGIKSYFGHGIAPLRHKGYYGKNAKWDGSFERYIKRIKQPVNIHITWYAVNTLRAQLQYCRERHIQTVLVFPPIYHEFIDHTKNYASIMRVFHKCAEEYSVPFLDYSGLPISYDKSNFYNSQHLNKKGAEIFTATLARDIHNLIQAGK